MMPRVRSRNAYQHISEFDKGRMVAHRDCGLSYRRIAARVGRDPMTTFLDVEKVRLLAWLAPSPDLSPIENV
ncbi:hypothetical protein TNCV_1631011 [Trichonephila clavipes]|nr:hypothetical protein TNCV_1631011 [Trichonephila clavipes]